MIIAYVCIAVLALAFSFGIGFMCGLDVGAEKPKKTCALHGRTECKVCEDAIRALSSLAIVQKKPPRARMYDEDGHRMDCSCRQCL